MESLKPILLLVVLAGVGYGVYVALNHAPAPEPFPSVRAKTIRTAVKKPLPAER